MLGGAVGNEITYKENTPEWTNFVISLNLAFMLSYYFRPSAPIGAAHPAIRQISRAAWAAGLFEVSATRISDYLPMASSNYNLLKLISTWPRLYYMSGGIRNTS